MFFECHREFPTIFGRLSILIQESNILSSVGAGGNKNIIIIFDNASMDDSNLTGNTKQGRQHFVIKGISGISCRLPFTLK